MDTFNKDNNLQSPTEAIQDYLDLLLSPTLDAHNQVGESDSALAEPSLSGINSTESKLIDEIKNTSSQLNQQSLLERRRQHSDRASPLVKSNSYEPLAQTVAFERARPYADPVKSLTIRMPLPKVGSPSVDQALPAALVQEKPVPVVKSVERVIEKGELPAPNEHIESVDKTIVKGLDKALESMTASTSAELDNGRPVWAQERFQCLLFTVGGLTLAVPLVELGSIYPLNKPLTHLFGQIDWFMGLLTLKEQRIRTVNTAKVVMPERYKEEMAANFHYVITINDVDWGLAVDNVATAITLEPNEVNWRTQRGKRPWLAGTVVEYMCALLDVGQLAAMFTEQDKAR